MIAAVFRLTFDYLAMAGHGYSRRRFISAASAVTVSAGLTGQAEAQASAIPRRKFGRHPDEVSILGLGGHHLGNAATVQDAISILH
ncbi:MAG: twin-arginine translocation signal domain-containing protein, partial [Acidobacteriaceae bacterium]|nr:twin-arginine translocation signal domain-containing protein [Acidobacteriaceae bacterium]